jgi:hypothetical protein
VAPDKAAFLVRLPLDHHQGAAGSAIVSPRRPKSPKDFKRSGTFPIDPFITNGESDAHQNGLGEFEKILGTELTEEQRDLLIEASQSYLIQKEAFASGPMLGEAESQIKGLVLSVGNNSEGFLKAFKDLSGCALDQLETTSVWVRHRIPEVDSDIIPTELFADINAAVLEYQRQNETEEAYWSSATQYISYVCRAALDRISIIKPKGRPRKFIALQSYIRKLQQLYELATLKKATLTFDPINVKFCGHFLELVTLCIKDLPQISSPPLTKGGEGGFFYAIQGQIPLRSSFLQRGTSPVDLFTDKH